MTCTCALSSLHMRTQKKPAILHADAPAVPGPGTARVQVRHSYEAQLAQRSASLDQALARVAELEAQVALLQQQALWQQQQPAQVQAANNILPGPLPGSSSGGSIGGPTLSLDQPGGGAPAPPRGPPLSSPPSKGPAPPATPQVGHACASVRGHLAGMMCAVVPAVVPVVPCIRRAYGTTHLVSRHTSMLIPRGQISCVAMPCVCAFEQPHVALPHERSLVACGTAPHRGTAMQGGQGLGAAVMERTAPAVSPQQPMPLNLVTPSAPPPPGATAPKPVTTTTTAPAAAAAAEPQRNGGLLGGLFGGMFGGRKPAAAPPPAPAPATPAQSAAQEPRSVPMADAVGQSVEGAGKGGRPGLVVLAAGPGLGIIWCACVCCARARVCVCLRLCRGLAWCAVSGGRIHMRDRTSVACA